MAQIIKHRRGGIDAIASATAKKGELVMATGSVGQLNGPFIFIGETDGAAGGFRSVSKIYQGSTAPDLSNNNWGTTLNGTPFYSSNDDTLYILGNGGNTAIDLTGNIEGNIIDSVTINNLDGNLNLVGDLMITGDTYQTGSITLTGDVTLRGNINIGDNLTGDTVTLNGEISSSLLPADTNAFSLGASGQTWSDVWAENAHFTNISLDTISFAGLTEGRVVTVGASGSLVDNGNFNFDGSQVGVSGSIKLNDTSYIYNDVALFVEDNTNGVTIQSNNYAELQSSNAWVWVEGNNAYVEGGNHTKISTNNGNVDIESISGSINIHSQNGVNVTGSLIVSDASGVINSSLNVNNSNLTLNSGSNLDIQNGGTATIDGNATFNSNVYGDYYRSLTNNNNALYFNYNSPTSAAPVELWSDQGDLSLYANSGSIRLTGSVHISNDLNLNGELTANSAVINGNVYVSGNLEILGSATEVHIQSQVVELDDNIIRLNAYSPFERYAGFEVIDSGSTGVSASMVWDSLGDYWMFVSSSGQSSKMIGTTAGTYGSENSLTNNMIPKATGLTTIGDSLLSDDGTTLTYNTNKFTVDSASGDTYINGNVTLNSGGTDSGNKTSGIVFRNNDGILGFVSTTETTDVLDGILGYKNSDGGLVFSTVIDGGSY